MISTTAKLVDSQNQSNSVAKINSHLLLKSIGICLMFWTRQRNNGSKIHSEFVLRKQELNHFNQWTLTLNLVHMSQTNTFSKLLNAISLFKMELWVKIKESLLKKNKEQQNKLKRITLQFQKPKLCWDRLRKTNMMMPWTKKLIHQSRWILG